MCPHTVVVILGTVLVLILIILLIEKTLGLYWLCFWSRNKFIDHKLQPSDKDVVCRQYVRVFKVQNELRKALIEIKSKRQEERYEGIKEILRRIGLEIPENKEEDFRKAFNEIDFNSVLEEQYIILKGSLEKIGLTLTNETKITFEDIKQITQLALTIPIDNRNQLTFKVEQSKNKNHITLIPDERTCNLIPEAGKSIELNPKRNLSLEAVQIQLVYVDIKGVL